PTLVFGPADSPVRRLHLLRDTSVDELALGNVARYFLEPPLVPLPAAAPGPLPELPWVSRLRLRADGRPALRGRFLLFNRDLKRLAEHFLEVADRSCLRQRAAQRDGAGPVTVVVERLAPSYISMALARRDEPERILAYGEAQADNAVNDVEITLTTSAANLAE